MSQGQVRIHIVLLACSQQRVNEHLIDSVSQMLWLLIKEIRDLLPYHFLGACLFICFYFCGPNVCTHYLAQVVLVLILK